MSSALKSLAPLKESSHPNVFLFRILILTFLRLRMSSVTSSTTPGIVENSCKTPSILTAEIAAPVREDNKTLLSELPNVTPNPLSNG